MIRTRKTRLFSSPYPRDISALRDAYQKQAVGENESAQSPHLVLRENSEAMQPVEETDSVTTYSGRIERAFSGSSTLCDRELSTH